jgi:tetratricopeptide (TPR) repeat protein
MVGKLKEAKSTLQVAIYQYMINLFGALTDYLVLCADNIGQFDKTYKIANDISDAFGLEKLHPSLLIKLYIVAAQGYAMLGNKERAMEILEKYAELVTGDIYPLKLKGDEYFYLIDQWIEELDLGKSLPRSEKIIRRSMADGVINNPAFAIYADDSRYKRIVEKLNELLKA